MALTAGLIDFLIRSTALCLAAWLVAAGFRRHPAYQHAVWCVALVGLIFILPISRKAEPLWVPVSHEKALELATTVRHLSRPGPVYRWSRNPEPAPMTPSDWAQVGYLAVSALLLLRLYRGLRHLRRVRDSAVPIDVPHADALDVRETAMVDAPLTAGVLHPVVLLPMHWRDWDAETLDSVLAHEQAHVERRDCLWQMVSAIGRALVWVHPGAWLASAQLARLAEQACDDRVLIRRGNRDAYAKALLQIARESPSGPMFGIAMSPTAQRIQRVLSHASPQIPKLRNVAAIWLVGTASVYALAALQAARPEPTSAWQKFLEAETMRAEQAQELERAIARGGAEAESRAKLVLYYAAHKDSRATIHLAWLIEKEPLYPHLSIVSHRTEELTQQAATLWKGQIARNPDNVDVLRNAARELFGFDCQTALDAVERAYRLASAANQQPFLMVMFYAHLLEQQNAGRFSSPAMAGCAERVRRTVDGSNDPWVIGMLGQHLGSMVQSARPDQASLVAYGEELLRRASTVEPENGEWRGHLKQLEQQKRAVLWNGGAGSEDMIGLDADQLNSRRTQFVEPKFSSLATPDKLRFQVIVAVDGTVEQVRLLEGPEIHAEQARAAILQWRYLPVRVDGQARRVMSEVAVVVKPGQ